ncbi:DUF262 domain-containing HNH endonuclease family protein [Brachybacterium phenoliresistens]|uniref:DUF262 domain-containing protein n=1 Tax=Brachybacterium phenoliresistens TaxID=396014 RepID=UPI0031CDC629
MSTTAAADAAIAVPIGELFSSSSVKYQIPLYQRNYTWGEEQIDRLIDDVLDEAERPVWKDYFLGNLVVAPPVRVDDPFDVIDGQQRLTTLYILLMKLSEHQHPIGELHPLTYESREKSTLALRGILAPQHENEDREHEDAGILRARRRIELRLHDNELTRRLEESDFVDYLLTRVKLIRMPVHSKDLNRYFEVMNTRGLQLSPVDIVKARLLRCLTGDADRALLNKVWTACSDMDHYVSMTVTSDSTEWRGQVFGPDWDDAPTADFTMLRTQLVDRSPGADKAVGTASALVTGSLAFEDAITAYAQAPEARTETGSDDSERFSSQISFATLLLHVLAVRRPDTGTVTNERDLDDKLLIRRFTDELGGKDAGAQEAWVRSFTTDLLRTRFLFDRCVLKRDATLTSTHESSSDEEPGSWSLSRVVRGTSNGKTSPRYQPAFASDEFGAGPRSVHRRLLLLQSALRVTYTSPRSMHWMTEVLRYATDCAARGARVDGAGLLEHLEAFTRERVAQALFPVSAPDEVAADGTPLGFGVPRIVFTYLDYLLVETMNSWDFTFSYRTSIEHFSPRTEDSEHASSAYRVEDRELLDTLGNLALVTVSANSKFSNYQPQEKANNAAARRQSLKLELMARRAKASGWSDQDIRAHHEEMVGVLRRNLDKSRHARTTP